MQLMTTLVAAVAGRVRREERGAALALEAMAIAVMGVLLLLAFLPAGRDFVVDVVAWVRENTIGS